MTLKSNDLVPVMSRGGAVHDLDVKIEHDLPDDQGVFETDAIEHDMMSRQPSHLYVAIDEIKGEYVDCATQDVTHQENIFAEHITHSNMVCTSMISENFIHDIKAENENQNVKCELTTTKDFVTEDIKVEIIQELVTPEKFTNIEMVCRTKLLSDVDENCGMMNQDGVSKSAINTDVKCRAISLGEDYSPVAGLPSVEIIPKVELNNTAVQQVEHRRTHSEKKTFTCEVCHKIFNKKRNLVVHTRLHSGEKPFTCDICNKAFTYKSDLVKHMKIHSGEKPYSCDVCNKAFAKKSNLLQHMYVHRTEKSFSCGVCKSKLSRKSTLVKHMKIHSEEKPFLCDVCNKAFTGESDLLKHLKIHSGIKPLSCHICNKAFTLKCYLAKHMKIHSRNKKLSCTNKFNITDQENISSSGDMVCRSTPTQDIIHNIKPEIENYDVECGSTTTKDFVTDDVKVEIIQEIVTPEKFTNIEMMCRSKSLSDVDENCGVMNQDGASKSATNTDVKCGDVSLGEDYSPVTGLPSTETIRKVELSDTAVQKVTMVPYESKCLTYMTTAEKSFSCNVCHKRFSRKSCLVKHFRTHSGKKPFTCDVCHKGFNRKCNLLTHTKRHSGEKPFTCEVCLKKFFEKSSLVSHMGIHSDEKPFTCDICHKGFNRKGNLLTHTKRHSGEKPFQCKVCHKRFTAKGCLIKHLRIHSGEKPFQCKVCRKKFSQKGSLMRHTGQHLGENPFTCEICHKGFNHKSYLVRHLRKHSEKNKLR